MPVLGLLACLTAGCEQFRTAAKFKPDDDPAARVEPVGGGTLVVRGFLHSSRVGLISLDTGERHVLELEHPCEEAPGSFAGPDAQGRYAYVTYSKELERSPPAGGSALMLYASGTGPIERALVGLTEALGPDQLELYRESWRSKRDAPRGAIAHWLFDPEPTRIVVGELGRPGERVLVSRHPADLLQSLIALAPSSGELAFFVFDFDAQKAPTGLHLEIWDLDGGAPRRIPLGRIYLDMRSRQGPGLAWLGDERHLLFKRDTGVRDTGGMFEIDGDWNGRTDSSGIDSERNPPRTGFVLCVLDTQTGEWHDLDKGPYGWPTGSGDELIASDGEQLWLVHAADGASELLRAIEPASLLRARGHDGLEPGLAVVAALGPERILARCTADEHAALPRAWSNALTAQSTGVGLQLVASREERAQPCVPRLSVGHVQLANGKLPADLPWILRRLPPRGADD